MATKSGLDDLINILDDNDMSFINTAVSGTDQSGSEDLLDQLTKEILEEEQYPNENPVVEPIQFTIAIASSPSVASYL